jgi:hypothetical protein
MVGGNTGNKNGFKLEADNAYKMSNNMESLQILFSKTLKKHLIMR